MGAIKILPIIDVIIEKPRILHIEESFSPFTIIKAFVSRDIQLFTPTEGKMWLEFGNYIGIVPFILFLIGSIQLWKKHKDLIVTAWLFIILSHGGVIWKVINQIPGYSFFQTPSRFLLISLICIALISGIYIKRFNYKICLIITLVVVVDLLIVNGVHIRNSFQIEPINITESDMFYQSYSPEMKTYDLIAALSGIGSVTCYESFLIKNAAKEGLIFYHRGHAIDIRDSAYLGEAHSENKNVKIKTWTPNKILLGSPKAIINQNYHRGWQQSTEANGLIETNGPITFYLPKSFIFGSLISFITITFSLYRIRRFSS